MYNFDFFNLSIFITILMRGDTMETSLISQLTAIVGKENVEEDNGKVIIYPSTTPQVSDVFKLATSTDTKIVIRKKPNQVLKEEKAGILVLDLSKFNSLIDLDKDNVTATIQTGMTLDSLQQQLMEKGFYLPPVSIWDYDNFVAAAVADNSIGFNTARYGRWREFSLGMEAVLYSGEVIKVGGKVIKYVAGLDMMGLIIGTKNQLGVITEMTLRLLPKPEARKMLVSSFDSLPDAIAASLSLPGRKLDPARNEVITSAIAEKMGLPGVNPGQIAVITELEGFANSLGRQGAEVEVAHKKFGLKSFVVIDKEDESKLIWDKYFKAADLYKGQTTYNVNILPSKLEGLNQFINSRAKELGLELELIIHSGVANMDMFMQGDADKLETFKEELIKNLRVVDGKLAEQKIGIGSHIATIDRLEEGLRDLFDPKHLLVSTEGKVN